MELKSPIAAVREALGLSKQEFSGVMYLSPNQCGLFEEGAFEQVPAVLVKLMDECIGEGTGDRLADDYRKFRETLGAEARAALEKRLYPAGRCYGMCE